MKNPKLFMFLLSRDGRVSLTISGMMLVADSGRTSRSVWLAGRKLKLDSYHDWFSMIIWDLGGVIKCHPFLLGVDQSSCKCWW